MVTIVKFDEDDPVFVKLELLKQFKCGLLHCRSLKYFDIGIDLAQNDQTRLNLIPLVERVAIPPQPYYLLFRGIHSPIAHMYRLCYLRGPEGIIVALAEKLGSKSASKGRMLTFIIFKQRPSQRPIA